MPLSTRALPILSDNYAWLLRAEAAGAVAIVDPADADACIEAIETEGGRLDLILLTHHHDDHIAGTDAVRQRFGAKVVGAAADRHRLPRLDQEVREGDAVRLGECTLEVIETPGHTRGHISFFCPQGDVLICADTLFSLGCGRLIEGTPAEMCDSLRKLARLPGDTLVCCGHEYTQSNARFALHVDPCNDALRRRAAEVDRLRAEGKATVPSRLADELAENPFLRAPDVATLADIRKQKDNFR
jgi:hydroxyacylglutathione hydrolase